MSREEIEAEASKAAEQAFESWHFASCMSEGMVQMDELHTPYRKKLAQAFAAGVLHAGKCQAKIEEMKEVLG